MKALVLYYSFSGNTRLIAEMVAKELNADLEELKPVKPLNASPLKHDTAENRQKAAVWASTLT